MIDRFRQELQALLTEPETAELDDETWYDRFWELLEPVIDARAERQLNAVSNATRNAERCPMTWNPGEWPYTARCVFNTGHTGRHEDRKGHVHVEVMT